MRIEEFSIRQYGPLPDTGRISLSNFNLFSGRNEYGKTLIIDALVKTLFGQNRSIFKGIDRVDADPDGYIIIENDEGMKIKLPEKGDLTKIVDISSSECRNLFIIRNSDLSIAQDFYTNITDRLTGLRTKEISSIKQKLREIGKLTRADSNGSISDRSEWGKIRTRVEKAKALMEDIEEMKGKVEQANFDQMEERVSQITEKMSKLERNLCNLKDARKREQYEKGHNTLRQLKMALENLKGLDLEKIEKLKSKLNNYKETKEKLSILEPKSKFITKATIASVALLLVSILGIIARPMFFLYCLTVSFIISTVVLGIFEFSFVMKRIQLAAAFKEIRSSASQLQVGAESTESVLSNIEKVDGYLKSKDNAEIRLDSYFGKRSDNLEENLSHWAQEIDTLKMYEDKAKDAMYDEKKVSQLETERKILLDKREKMDKKMRSFCEELKEVERKANEIIQPEGDYFHCSTSIDLNVIGDKLKNFADKVENNTSNVLEVMRIFEEIEKEEERKISDLFGKGSLVSKYFCEITGGIYQEVIFVPDKRKIQVKLKNGDTLNAEKLSGGAYDQLYLSIRVALGEKRLKGNGGFFIMDDPFIKADEERLRKQIDIIRKISKSGWQIIYFTAKNEVRDALREEIRHNKVNHVEINPIYAGA